MDLRSKLSTLRKGVSDPVSAVQFLSRGAYRKFALPPSIYVNSRFSIGENIFESEWDLLIILDTCRPDALNAVAKEYPFIDNVDTKYSVGGDSLEWMAKTFESKYQDIINNTALITSNPHSLTVFEHQLETDQHGRRDTEKIRWANRYGDYSFVSTTDFGKYVSLYEFSIENNQSAYPSPRAVTDHGIATDRESDFDRIILHYMPPHRPYLAPNRDEDEISENNRLTEEDLRKSRRDNIFDAYLDNLRWGLDEVSLLLENVNREKVVITADHGENFNKFFPNHFLGSFLPTVRKVPWVETTGRDQGTYSPDLESGKSEYSQDEMLEALGYK